MSLKAMIILLPCVSCCILILWNVLPLEGKCRKQQLNLNSVAAADFSPQQQPSAETELLLSRKKEKIMERLRSLSSPSPNTSSSSSSSSSLRTANESCSGKRIYIHKLPPKFNLQILQECRTFLPWYSMCDYFENSGMGIPVVADHHDHQQQQSVLAPEGKWFQTNQYTLDVLFHHKLLHYPCLTDSPDEAVLLYVPYYAGLDVLRHHYTNHSLEKKNQLGVELIDWLKQQQPWWRRSLGRDHLLVMGKITWDFRRSNVGNWGNTLLRMPDFERLLKLLIERDPWQLNEIAVPHPTYFHPSSDSDISTWISRIQSSTRKHLISFAGMPRQPTHIRTHLISQCKNSSLCKLLACGATSCNSPEPTMKLFLSSQFCMQPPGDSVTRRSLFDSLIAGCIPVLFDPDTAYNQYPWHLPDDPASYSAFVSSHDVKENKVDVISFVAGIPEEQAEKMRSKIINEIVPGLLYSQPGTKLVNFEDAFDISIRRILNRVANSL